MKERRHDDYLARECSCPLPDCCQFYCRKSCRNQVQDQARGKTWNQVQDQVQDRVWSRVRGRVQDRVENEVEAQALGQVQYRMWFQVFSRSLGGQHDAPWLATLGFWSQVLVDIPDVSGLLRVGRSAGWWWPLEGAVVLTERHTTLHLDAQGRLHCEDGPAVAYPDGWGVCAWHGTRVPEGLVTEGWGVQRIISEPNTEVRRCAIERMGWDRFIREARLKQVGEPQPDPGNPGRALALYDVPPEIYGDNQHVRVLFCDNASPERDGTRRRYGLTVPADISTPLKAAAWSFGISVTEYQMIDRAS